MFYQLTFFIFFNLIFIAIVGDPLFVRKIVVALQYQNLEWCCKKYAVIIV
jgi:hypothetical protein